MYRDVSYQSEHKNVPFELAIEPMQTPDGRSRVWLVSFRVCLNGEHWTDFTPCRERGANTYESAQEIGVNAAIDFINNQQ